MSLLDDMLKAVRDLNRRGVYPVRIEHASPDFIDSLRRRCTVNDASLPPGARFAGIDIMLNPKLPLGSVRTIMSDGSVLAQRVELFSDPFGAKSS